MVDGPTSQPGHCIVWVDMIIRDIIRVISDIMVSRIIMVIRVIRVIRLLGYYVIMVM